MDARVASHKTSLGGPSGRWFRRGPIIVVDLGRGGLRGPGRTVTVTAESELGAETAGSVPDKDYLRWIQGALNLFFEKTGRSERVKANGEDSAEYRKAVKLFKSLAKVKPVDDKVDEKTQNALILANESNQKYLAWLRTALDKLGYAYLTSVYEKHEKPVAAIREFQKDYDGRFGFKLYADGFVGAKTHIALLHALRPPKPTPSKPTPPAKVTDEQLYNKLLRAEEWIHEYDDPGLRPTELCVIAKLKLPATDDSYFNPGSIHAFMDTRLGSGKSLFDFVRSARRTLKAFMKRRWAMNRSVTPESVVEKIEEIVGDMADGIRSLEISYCDDPRLPATQREIKELSKRSKSLYNCPVMKRQAEAMKQCVG